MRAIRRLALPLLSLVLLLAPAHAAVAQQGGGAAASDSTGKEGKGLPLQAARTISFSTSEGTWISVDVSPDGSTLVFDLLGDLYTMPMAGGRATRLTSGMAYDAQPRFSPDGKSVVFVSDRDGGNNVWTMALDGSDTTQVTKGKDFEYASPEWTPDGEYIVASKGTRIAQLWLFHRDGGGGAQLIDEPQTLKTMGAAFGPDPRYIWFAERQGDWQYNAIFPQYEIAVYDRRNGKRTTMTGRVGSAFRPTISPDGKWMVYGTRLDAKTGLILRNQDTGEERWLAYPVQRDDQESVAPLDVLPGMSFTPDGSSVVASYGGRIWSIPVDGSDPSEIPFTADVSVELGPLSRFEYRVDTSPTFTAHQIRDAVPSPDGRRLAFTSLDKLYVMDYPGGTPRRLTETGTGIVEAQPAWSPDGRQLAYVSWEDQDAGYVWKVAANGSGSPQRLTPEGALYREPVWSPDGARVVAVRVAARELHEALGGFGGGLGAQFVWMPAAGGEVNMIAPTGGREHPHFTSDPDRIYAYSGGDGLVSFRWDGTDERTIVKVTGKTPPGSRQPQRADQVLMAPEGDQALVLLEHELYVVTVPMFGGDTLTISVGNPENAAFPARKLSVVGGEFPAWSADGRTAHWSIGNTHFAYDLDRARAFDDSVRAAAAGAGAQGDSAGAKPPRYEPTSHEIDITVQRDIPSGVAVLRGARLVTMNGDQVIENGDVVVRNDRIEAVGARGSVDVPSGARVIDVSGKTIIPGLVDTHYHPQWLIPDIHSSQAWQYLAELAYGTTTTRDPQTSTTDVLTYEDKVENGEMIGPRIYSTGPGVFSSEMISSLDDARHVLERYAKYYDTKTLKMYMTGNRQQRQWVIMAAHELGLSPTTEGGLDFKLDMTHIMDGYAGVEHAIPIEPMYSDVVRFLAEAKTVNSPTLIVSYGGPFGENYFYTRGDGVHDDAKLARFTPHQELDAKTRRRGTGSGGSPGPGGWFMDEEYVFPLHAAFAKQVVDAGGRVGVGSHGQLQGLGMHWEMWMMATGGMTPMEVLRSATMSGAWAIGMERDLGSIEAGKLADLVVLDANPLDDIHNTNTIRYVMKNGRLYEGDTLDEIYPRERPLPPLVWHEPEPNTAAGIR